jgi:hypothetical protein
MEDQAKKLYELYVEANEAHDCAVDSWDSLNEQERFVWEYMSQRLTID